MPLSPEDSSLNIHEVNQISDYLYFFYLRFFLVLNFSVWGQSEPVELCVPLHCHKNQVSEITSYLTICATLFKCVLEKRFRWDSDWTNFYYKNTGVPIFFYAKLSILRKGTLQKVHPSQKWSLSRIGGWVCVICCSNTYFRHLRNFLLQKYWGADLFYAKLSILRKGTLQKVYPSQKWSEMIWCVVVRFSFVDGL